MSSHRRLHAAATVAAASLVFGFSWLFRFNDPGGSYAGLTDDHFFYVVRAWQILFGDLPVRDFVDHGAPLFYYAGAAVQMLFGRGTASEVAFTVTLLAMGAALTFWLATRASGSIVAGLIAALFHIRLEPRLYNYPKILVYAVAVPLLWRFADRPDARTRFWLALTTAVAFLLRHDHGVFVAVGLAALLLALTQLSWRERLRHALAYAVLTILLLAPYLVFIEINGGVISYFRQASAWAARDRDRAPVVFPGLFDTPAPASNEARGDSLPGRAVAAVRSNRVAWTYYMELALPFLGLAMLALSRDAFRPQWPHAAPKLITVIVLAAALNAGFLRSPLEARLADPSVPHAILIAWLMVAVTRMLTRRDSLSPPLRPRAVLVRLAVCMVAAPCAIVVWSGLTTNLQRRLETSALTGGLGDAIERVGEVHEQLREDWRIESWRDRENRPDLIELALYLNACTRPDDRIFMQHYAPQVLGMARRAFAGGHADLRPGFFTTVEAQSLTIERLRRQQVPVVLLQTGDDYANFRTSFPLITTYLDERYSVGARRQFDSRFGVQLLVRRDASPRRVYEPFGWPCFGEDDRATGGTIQLQP